MDIQLTTPALLFPAVSLLLLAYTNRFLALATLVRSLHAQYLEEHQSTILPQIKNLKMRLTLIKAMQALGVSSLLLCVICMFALFQNYLFLGRIIFGVSLLLMIGSLLVSVWEIHISSFALNLQISDLEINHKRKKEKT